MAIQRKSLNVPVLLSGLCVALSGCAQTPLGPTVQVMPGPGKNFAQFQTDQDSCKTYAADQVKGQADIANRQAVGAAALTTLLGAGLGAGIGAAAGDAGAGAAIGAAAGGVGGSAYGAGNTANAQAGIQVQYDNAFSQCMYAKGEQVPGYAPLVAAVPPAAAVADPMVRSTQRELIRLGYLHGVADGVMGPKTESAIVSYESSHGMAANGAASSQLLARLQSTPSGAAVTATAPAGWVAPAGSAAPAGTASNWVAPASGGTPAVTPASATAPASGWVAPTKTP